MSQYYGTVKGSAKTQATRQGGKSSGIETFAASWAGAVRVRLFTSSDGRECYMIGLAPWHGEGPSLEIARGTVGYAPDWINPEAIQHAQKAAAE